MSDIKGEIGIKDVYRGGMDIHRYGKAEDRLTPDRIVQLAIFAVGQDADTTEVKVKLVEEAANGEKYEISWSKSYEMTYVMVGIFAARIQTPYPLFDYLSDFVNLIKTQKVSK